MVWDSPEPALCGVYLAVSSLRFIEISDILMISIYCLVLLSDFIPLAQGALLTAFLFSAACN